jgi:hypothetical protein
MTITFSHRGSDRNARIETWIAVGGATLLLAIGLLTAGCSSAPSLSPDADGDADLPVEDLRAAAMAELRDAQLGLVSWRFRLDPERRDEADLAEEKLQRLASEYEELATSAPRIVMRDEKVRGGRPHQG